jgi:hypothetical protein
MFITLLVVVFVIAVLVSAIVARVFEKPVRQMLEQIVSPELSVAWLRYLKFAVYVVGISGGVRVWQLERYISKRTAAEEILELTRPRWFIEIYQTIIGTLQGIVWLLLVFFVFTLIGYIIIRALETRRSKAEN